MDNYLVLNRLNFSHDAHWCATWDTNPMANMHTLNVTAIIDGGRQSQPVEVSCTGVAN